MHARTAMSRSMSPRFRSTAVVAGMIACAACACGESASPPQIARFEPLAAGTCRAWEGQPIDRVCVPRLVRENAPIALEIAESCGACGTTADRCTVTVEQKDVTLSLDGKVCEPPPGVSCSQECARRRVVCRIPPLLAGRYVLRWGDMSGRVDTLDVTTDPAAPSSCALSNGEPGT